MKKLKLFSMLLLLIIGFGQVWGVTITGAAYQGKGGSSGSGGSATATVDGVTITSTKAYYASDSEIREYQNGTLTVSSSSTITSIVITCTGDNRANFSTTAGTLSAKGTSPQTWTGSATSVTFTADAQSRWSSIEVTLSGGSTEPTGFLNQVFFLSSYFTQLMVISKASRG